MSLVVSKPVFCEALGDPDCPTIPAYDFLRYRRGSFVSMRMGGRGVVGCWGAITFEEGDGSVM